MNLIQYINQGLLTGQTRTYNIYIDIIEQIFQLSLCLLTDLGCAVFVYLQTFWWGICCEEVLFVCFAFIMLHWSPFHQYTEQNFLAVWHDSLSQFFSSSSSFELRQFMVTPDFPNLTYLAVVQGWSLALVTERNPCFETGVWTKIHPSLPMRISGGEKQQV